MWSRGGCGTHDAIGSLGLKLDLALAQDVRAARPVLRQQVCVRAEEGSAGGLAMPAQEQKSDQPSSISSVIVLHPACKRRGKGLSTGARLADILEHDRLGHLTESAHGGQSRISLSRGRGRRVDSALGVGVALSFNWHTKGGRGRKGRRSTCERDEAGENKREGVKYEAGRAPGLRVRQEPSIPREPTHHKITERRSDLS